MNEQVRNIPISQLHSFCNHPFQVKDDEAMTILCDSIRKYGILSPLMARPAGEGYEVVSGHRRRLAAMKLGLQELPVLVRVMTDDEAVILMVDSNIQRENLLPSEKAFAYKMKLEAIKHQGKAAFRRVVGKLESADHISKSESGRTVQRYIRLTYLVKPILDLVDQGHIAFSPAVELSFLTRQEQAELWDIMQCEDRTPSLSQAVRLKKLSQRGELNPERIYEIMSEEKANQKERVRIEVDQLRKYFPKGYTVQQMERRILQILEENYRNNSANE